MNKSFIFALTLSLSSSCYGFFAHHHDASKPQRGRLPLSGFLLLTGKKREKEEEK